jgi:transposase
LIRDLSCGDKQVYLSLKVRRVDCWRCGKVKTERLDWLSDLPGYTKRFAFLVGRRCHDTPVKAVAEELKLDWQTVKELDKLYMREQLRRAPPANPKVIGIDEISMGKGQKYRIVVSDLLKGRPIWFGGKDRSEASLDEFFTWLGPKKSKKIRLAVMDMWQAFRNSTLKIGNAPQAKILYDKFHVVAHLQKAMDQVRRNEYARLKGKDRRYIKGHRYTLLSHKRNLSLQGRRALKVLLGANKRLNTAYVLKEQFEQLWEYRVAGWARRFFEHWRESLKWQRLKPFEKFAAMIEEHWDGIVTYCDEQNHAMLGFVEGFNNKIRAIQRRAFGIRDEEYLRLKILSSMLPKIVE